MKIQDFDYPDMEPLLIWKGDRSLDKMIWVHPYIDTWFEMGEDGCDQNMHIVTFNCGSDTFSVAIKSNWIDNRYDKYFSEVDWENSNTQMYDEVYVDTKLIFEYLIVLLEEDVYVPLPRSNIKLNTIRKICEYREKYSLGQFCFTGAGEWVSNSLMNCIGANFNSDCGFHHDSKSDTWGYDT